MKTGIFYGSTTGTTAKVASEIAQILGVEISDVHNVAETAPSAVGDYELLIFGASTWGDGDLQEDMDDFLAGVEVLDLKGKKVATFGCGDETNADTFCDGVGQMYDRLVKTGARMIGGYDTIGYRYDKSDAVPENAAEAEGLLIDEDNHPDLTGKRVAAWCKQIVAESMK